MSRKARSFSRAAFERAIDGPAPAMLVTLLEKGFIDGFEFPDDDPDKVIVYTTKKLRNAEIKALFNEETGQGESEDPNE